MRRPIRPFRAFLNAVACLAILALAIAGGVQVARRHWLVQQTFQVRVDFPTIGGVEPGGKVYIQGIDAGTIESILPPSKPGDPVTLLMQVDERLKPLVRSDAVARIAMQGVVGSRIVEITPGSPDAAPLGPDGRIASEAPVELADLMSKARSSLQRVDAVSVAAEQGLAEVTAIVGSIREGEGSIGRLVSDNEAYDRLVRLTDEGEKTLGELNENLDAVKNTWPISSYFNRRGYSDRDRALFRPGDTRQSRAFAVTDLFEPGRSVLTLPGRRSLDELARWLEPKLKRESDVVVAAFGEQDRDPKLSEILSQEQAEAVRRYLIEEHGLDSAGWFRTRKVAAIGYGASTPRALPEPDLDLASLPLQRVEIIIFTPSA
jgi:phospholipid/cholesterol/gamma-HCH transport system substrate-binding protein